MLHARPDYEHIQDPSGKIPADEPVMLFRAQDKHFEAVCLFYASLVEQDNGDPGIVARARAHARRGLAWPKKKAPDLPDTSAP